MMGSQLLSSDARKALQEGVISTKDTAAARDVSMLSVLGGIDAEALVAKYVIHARGFLVLVLLLARWTTVFGGAVAKSFTVKGNCCTFD